MGSPAIASAPVTCRIKELVDVAIVAVSNFLEGCGTSADMRNACIVWSKPINVIHTKTAYGADELWLFLLIQNKKACDTTFSNCFVDDGTILNTGLWSGVRTIFTFFL